jgi:hypothetical protein
VKGQAEIGVLTHKSVSSLLNIWLTVREKPAAGSFYDSRRFSGRKAIFISRIPFGFCFN